MKKRVSRKFAGYKTMLPDKKMLQAKLHESTRYFLRLRIEMGKKVRITFRLVVYSIAGI
jgi:hypothetical protein